MEIEAAVETVRIVHHLLQDEETCHAFHIEMLLPVGRGLVWRIHRRIDGLEFSGEPLQLRVRQVFGRMIPECKVPTAVLRNGDLAFVPVVVYFHEPSSLNQCRIGLLILLFIYVHAVLVNADCLRQKIEAYIVSVENNLDRTEVRSPGHAHNPAQLKPGHGVLRRFEQCPMLVLGHAQQLSLITQLYLVRLLGTQP